MRGPALVGYPPSDLRWSGDSKEVYFEWRMPGEDEAATWVVGRDGGAPRRLTDEERKKAPLANGSWDQSRRRILGVDRGDIVVIDTVDRSRRDITRTTGNESQRTLGARRHVTSPSSATTISSSFQSTQRRRHIGPVDRRGAAPCGSAADGQSTSLARRRRQIARLGRAGSRAPQTSRSARSGPRIAKIRAGRATGRGRRRALSRREARVSGRGGSLPSPHRRKCPATLVSRLYRGDISEKQGGRHAGEASTGHPESRNRRGRVGRARGRG